MSSSNKITSLRPFLVRLRIFVDLPSTSLNATLYVGQFISAEDADTWLTGFNEAYRERNNKPYGGLVRLCYIEDADITQEQSYMQTDAGLLPPQDPVLFVEKIPHFALEKINSLVTLALDCFAHQNNER